MPGNTNSTSSSNQGSSASSSTTTIQDSGTSFGGSASVAKPADSLIQGLMMTPEDCQALFTGDESWDALDLYFINRCDSNKRLLIKSEHYTEEGVKLTWKSDGDVNTSGSPSDEYFVVKKAMVDIEFTLRNGLNIPDIKSLLMMGEVTDGAKQRVHTVTRRNTIRRRPPNYILIAVPEGEKPEPETVGGYLFPNVTLDLQTGLTLTHNAKDYQESQVKFTAKFTKGKDGVLSKVYIPK
jgi:hypothetical protein